LDTDKKIFANFSHILFQITSSSNPLEGGVTTGGGSYIIGDEVTVSAIPNQGWEFVNWT